MAEDDRLTPGEQRVDRAARTSKFESLAEAEKAFFHLRALVAERGQMIQRLSNRLGHARQRTRELTHHIEYLTLDNTKLNLRLQEKKARD